MLLLKLLDKGVMGNGECWACRAPRVMKVGEVVSSYRGYGPVGEVGEREGLDWGRSREDRLLEDPPAAVIQCVRARRCM
jgi:hypothetical protein